MAAGKIQSGFATDATDAQQILDHLTDDDKQNYATQMAYFHTHTPSPHTHTHARAHAHTQLVFTHEHNWQETRNVYEYTARKRKSGQ